MSKGQYGFKNIHALLGWAFQMSAADMGAKVQVFTDAPGGVGGLSVLEQRQQALDVLAKVGRLPELEQAVIAARFTLDQRSVNAAAKALPRIWMTGLRRELARSWANDKTLARSQAEIGETYMRSQPTINRHWKEACDVLDDLYGRGAAVLEVQLMDLLVSVSRCNAHRQRIAA